MALHPCGLSYPKPINFCLIMGKTVNPNEGHSTKYHASTPQNCKGLLYLYCSLFDTNSMKFVDLLYGLICNQFSKNTSCVLEMNILGSNS